jgi:hypothetical protein
MAVFKTLKAKKKEYTFKYEGNEKLKEPARAVFARFPRPDDTFFRRGQDAGYRDIDFTKVGKKDDAELEKLFSVFINSYIGNMVNSTVGGDMVFHKVDISAFILECVDPFENFAVETETGKLRVIKSAEDFLSLPQDAVYEIAKDLYLYARDRDKFSMGESKA